MNLPDLVFEQLRHLLDMGEQNQWAVGDFIRDVWDEIVQHVPESELKKEHGVMIIQMADRTGADKSTLYSREKMSHFYLKETRDKWSPPYTYHHLRALMSAGDNWHEVAEWGLTGGYNGGLATVQDIREHIKGTVEPDELTAKRLQRLGRLAKKIMEAPETPDNVREQMSLIPVMIDDALDLVP